MKPITSIDDPRYVKAMSHPLRVRILAMLDERTASPVELAGWLGSSLGTVAYHVRTLERMGLVELVHETRVRGAVEHHYRSVRAPAGLRRGMGRRPRHRQAGRRLRLTADDRRLRARGQRRRRLRPRQLPPHPHPAHARRPRLERALARVHAPARPGRPHRGVRQGAHRAQPAQRRHQGRRAGDDALRGRPPRRRDRRATRSRSAAGATAGRSARRSPTERRGQVSALTRYLPSLLAGSRTSTPSPLRLESRSRSSPPCSAACCATIASPRPVPPGPRLRRGRTARAAACADRAGCRGRRPRRSRSAARRRASPTRRCRRRAAVQRGVVEQVVDQQPQAALPAVDRALVDAAGELVLHPGMALRPRGPRRRARRRARPARGGGSRRPRRGRAPAGPPAGGPCGPARRSCRPRAPRAAPAAARGCGRACRAGRAVRSAACAARGRRRRRSAGWPPARARGGALRAQPREHLVQRARELAHLVRGAPSRRPAASRGPRRRRCGRRPRAAARAGAPPAWSGPRRRRGQRERDRAEQQHEPADAAHALLDRRERAGDLQPRVAEVGDLER